MPDYKAIAKRFFQVVFGLLLQVIVFFYAAGTLNVPSGWLYFEVYSVYLLVNMIIFLKLSPEVIAARSEIKFEKNWDKIFAIVYLICMLLIPAVAGLDLGRFYWSILGFEFAYLGLVLFVIGAAFSSWSIIENKFFETAVRIKKERGHKVVSSGPYAIVRHPGYVGIMLIYLASPLIFGSGYASIPAIMLAVAFVFRTYFEDRMLYEELDGYKEYIQKVKYRLMPGIW